MSARASDTSGTYIYTSVDASDTSATDNYTSDHASDTSGAYIYYVRQPIRYVPGRQIIGLLTYPIRVWMYLTGDLTCPAVD